MWRPLDVAGFVLAGGRSSRMGRAKALLTLAGRPLVEHAVTKLRRLCAKVAILSNNEELAGFAPIVKDRQPDCGPMSGIEAALTHASYDWSLILPVDVPFVPTAMLRGWMERVLRDPRNRLAMFHVGDVPQPTLLLVHREIAPYLTLALAQGRYKLYPELRAAAEDLRVRVGGEAGRELPYEAFVWGEGSSFSAGESSPAEPVWARSTEAQEGAGGLYFMNLNRPEDFAEAEKYVDVLDT